MVKTKIPENLTVDAVRARYKKFHLKPITGFTSQNGERCILGIGAEGVSERVGIDWRSTQDRACLTFRISPTYAAALEAGWEGWARDSSPARKRKPGRRATNEGSPFGRHSNPKTAKALSSASLAENGLVEATQSGSPVIPRRYVPLFKEKKREK